MAKIIDDETLDNVCVLAKLSLDENTREKTREDMQKMLDYVDKLNELDTDGVEPLTHLFAEEMCFGRIRWSTEIPERKYLPTRLR